MNIHRSHRRPPVWQRMVLAATASSVLLTGAAAPFAISAETSPLQISQQQSDWASTLRVARLVNVEQQTTDLVVHVDLANKPETTYANAVYQVFARQSGSWEVIYTNQGARLVSNAAGRHTLAPEVIAIRDLQERLQEQFGKGAELEDFELKTVVQIRYDAVGGRRDQRVEFEQVQSYQEIALATQTDLFAYQAQAGNFSLAISQPEGTLDQVIARVSLKSKQGETFQQEKFIGDYRYRLGQKIQFSEGLKAGDRIVVRLFDTNNRFIGYSEFDCLDAHSIVNLILADDIDRGVLRTVYGKDANFDGRIDQSVSTYDYFTQVTTVSQTSYRSAQVVFLESTQSISNLEAFNLSGLPAPPRRCQYPTYLERGSHALVNRRLNAFYGGLATAIVSVPGQVLDVINVTSSTTAVNISQLLDLNVDVRISEGVILNSCDFYCSDDDDDDRSRERDDDDRDRGQDDDDDDDDACDDDCLDRHEDDNQRQTITLSNGYRVTFLGVSYQANSSTWRYYVEELPSAQDLSNWVLGLPSCAAVASASPRGELVNPDPNARISGIKWQPGGSFVEGEFAVTLEGSLEVGTIQIAVKGPDVASGTINGPACQ